MAAAADSVAAIAKELRKRKAELPKEMQMLSRGREYKIYFCG